MLEKAQTKISINKCITDSSSQKHLSKPQSQTETIKFNKFDIVWAKITGYPWWPAIVTTLPGQKDSSNKEETLRNKYPWSKLCYNSKVEYRVDFIADQTHAFLKKNYILNYLQNRDRLYAEGLQFSSRKRRYFQMAINEADQLQQVLEISKAQADQLQKKQENRIKQSDDIQREKEENASSQIQEELQEELNEIKNSKFPTKAISSRATIGKQQNLQDSHSIENTIANQMKNFNFHNNSQKKQDNVIFVGPSAQKRKSRFSKIAETQFNRTAKYQKKNSANNLCQRKIQRSTRSNYQQTFAEKCERIFQQKESSFQIEQQQYFKNEVYEGQKMIIQRQQKLKKQQFPILSRRNQKIMEDLLQKYKLHTVDEIQSEFKRKGAEKNRFQGFSTLQSKGSMGLKGSKSMMFIKNIYSNISKRKNGKKEIEGKYYSNESNIFIQILSTLKNLNQSDHQKVQMQRKRMIQYSIKCTARKIYCIVEGIIKKKKILLSDEQVKANIKKRCINISQLLFDEEEGQDIKILKKSSSINNKKQYIHEIPTFFTSFKSKLETVVKLLRLLALQNWELIIKIAEFPEKICLQIKNFEQFLQKQCNLTMKNEQKFQDIVKHIGIENQKTAFLYGSLGNQMHPQDEPANFLTQKEKNQCNKRLVSSKNETIEIK